MHGELVGRGAAWVQVGYMSESDDSLVQYVQLQAVKRANLILLAALAEVLLEMNPTARSEFCQRLVAQIQEHLQSGEEDNSAHAGLLGVMLRTLIEAVAQDS